MREQTDDIFRDADTDAEGLSHSFSGASPPPPPPPAFLRAVARRRASRRILRITMPAAAILVAVVAALLILAPSAPSPAQMPPVAQGGRPVQDGESAAFLPTAYSLLHLNRDFDVDNLILPEVTAREDETLTNLGMAFDRRQLEKILTY